MKTPLVIDYFSDVLCVWAWIAQRRIDELKHNWPSEIRIEYHYLNLFGDTGERIGKQWRDRGGFAGFGQHVIESAAPYEHAPVNADIWRGATPKTSAAAHLVLKAVETIAGGPGSATELDQELRRRFFVSGLDIGRLDVALSVAVESGLDGDTLRKAIDSGEALAALMRDYQLAQQTGVKGSPSWVLNSGRQTLYGNVGYRVLHANVEELLHRPEQEASWC